MWLRLLDFRKEKGRVTMWMLPEQSPERNPSYRKSVVGKLLHNRLHAADIIFRTLEYGSGAPAWRAPGPDGREPEADAV